MIERLVLKEPLPYVGAEELINSKKETYDIVKKSFKTLEDTIEISVPDTEMAYIIELIYTE
jgi:transcriptional regulatory protein LevR